MNFKKGDIISFNRCRLVYIGPSEKEGRVIAEHLELGQGWKRDGDIPRDYKSVGVDYYWFVKPGEYWELVKAIESTYEIY